MSELTQRVKNKLRRVRIEGEREKEEENNDDWVRKNPKGIMEGSLTYYDVLERP